MLDPILHVMAMDYEIDQTSKEWEDDQEQDPDRFGKATYLASENVPEYREDQADPREEQKEHEQGPKHVQQRHAATPQSALFPRSPAIEGLVVEYR